MFLEELKLELKDLLRKCSDLIFHPLYMSGDFTRKQLTEIIDIFVDVYGRKKFLI